MADCLYNMYTENDGYDHIMLIKQYIFAVVIAPPCFPFLYYQTWLQFFVVLRQSTFRQLQTDILQTYISLFSVLKGQLIDQ